MPGAFQMCHAHLGQAWSRSGNTAPIVITPDGGPRAGWTPASQRSALLGLSHPGPGLHYQGRAGDVFPSWHSQDRGWCSRPRGALLDPILMSNCDYTATCGPKQRRECCLILVSSADSSPLYCIWQMNIKGSNSNNVTFTDLNSLQVPFYKTWNLEQVLRFKSHWSFTKGTFPVYQTFLVVWN